MEVKIEKLDNFGRGICYTNDKICFVEDSLPDEIVDIEITKSNKKYSEGKVVNFKNKSNKRIEEECPYSKICGGCNLNHISSEDENNFKEQKVKELVSKFTSTNPNLVKKIRYNDRNNYRNKIVLHGDNKELGLYKKSTNEIIKINNCLLVDDKINEIIRVLNEINKDIKKATIKVSNNKKEVMVDIVGEITNTNKLLDICDVLIINNIVLTDKKEIINPIGNKKYYESSKSFFQVNKTLTRELFDEVLNIIKNNNHNKVLDLYCGTGTIGIYVSDYCNNVIGIDYNESNINDANKNIELNDCKNIAFICDKVENKIDSFKDIDLVIVDPPRAGLDKKTKEYLKIIKPKQIIYISCDPVTLVRDLKDVEDSYNIESIKPFNMFPRTSHVESVSVLTKKNS